MIDQSLIQQSLMIYSPMLSWLIQNTVDPHHINYKWSRVSKNVFGLTEFRSRAAGMNIPWGPQARFAIPELQEPFDQCLDHIMNQRALHIFDQAKNLNKQIVIMWSGGIDSTAIVAAFIKNLSVADLDRLTICANTKSVSENPFFYETQIRDRFRMMHLTELQVSNEFFSKNILLHGDPGDCIFGPSTVSYQSLWENELYRCNWKDSVSLLYEIYTDRQDSNFSAWYVDMVNQQLTILQQQDLFGHVKSISDWHWWQYFNLKWQGSLTRPLLYFKADAKAPIQQDLLQEFYDLSFYAHKDFQIWSYQNLHRLLGSGIHNHKKQIKKYIFDLDNNQHYFGTKKKEGSKLLTWIAPLMIDQHAVHHYLDDKELVSMFVDLLTS